MTRSKHKHPRGRVDTQQQKAEAKGMSSCKEIVLAVGTYDSMVVCLTFDSQAPGQSVSHEYRQHALKRVVCYFNHRPGPAWEVPVQSSFRLSEGSGLQRPVAGVRQQRRDH